MFLFGATFRNCTKYLHRAAQDWYDEFKKPVESLTGFNALSTTGNNVMRLPTELWSQVFNCLEPNMRLRCGSVCKAWQRLSLQSDGDYWRSAVLETMGKECLIEKETVVSWRNLYIRAEYCRRLMSHVRYCCMPCIEKAAIDCESYLNNDNLTENHFEPLHVQQGRCPDSQSESSGNITTSEQREIIRQFHCRGVQETEDSRNAELKGTRESTGYQQECLLPARSQPYAFDREVALLCADLIFAKASAQSEQFASGLSGSYGYYLYTHRHHFNRALALLQRSLQIDPDDLSSVFVLAHLTHFQLRDLDLAKRYYTEVMESSETPFAECYIRLAMVQWQMSDLDDAEKTYETALSVVAEKDRNRVSNHYANYQIVLCEYEKAITIASKVVHVEPDNIHAVGTLALLLLLYKNKPGEARTLFRSVLPLITRTGPHTFGVLLIYSYAVLCALTGCQEEAQMYWRRAEQLDVFPDTFEFIETYYLRGIARTLPQYPFTVENLNAFIVFQNEMQIGQQGDIAVDGIV